MNPLTMFRNWWQGDRRKEAASTSPNKKKEPTPTATEENDCEASEQTPSESTARYTTGGYESAQPPRVYAVGGFVDGEPGVIERPLGEGVPVPLIDPRATKCPTCGSEALNKTIPKCNQCGTQFEFSRR